MQTIGAWLWDNRKSLITTALFGALLELLFFFPVYLTWWLVGLTIILLVGVWWLASFTRAWRRWWWLWAEAIWVVVGGLGLVVFSLLNMWQFQAITLGIVLVLLALLHTYDKYLQTGSWSVKSFSLLSFLDLVAFFAAGAAILTATDFYNLDPAWLMLAYLGQVILAANLRFWREEVVLCASDGRSGRRIALGYRFVASGGLPEIILAGHDLLRVPGLYFALQPRDADD